MHQAEAIDFLSDYISDLSDAWNESWEQLLTDYSDPALSKSCRAQILHDLAYNHFKTTRADDPNLTFRCEHNHQRVIIGRSVLLAFKKLSKDFQPSNNLTRRAQSLYQQEVMDTGEKANAYIICGAVVDDAWSQLDGVYLIEPRSHRHYNWKAELATVGNNMVDDQIAMAPVDTFEEEEYFRIEEVKKQRSKGKE
jgi:hypothetical protein